MNESDLARLERGPWPDFVRAVIRGGVEGFAKTVRQAMAEARRAKIKYLRNMWANIKAESGDRG